MACPHCNTPDPGPGPFCMNCGQRLSEDSSPGEAVGKAFDEARRASAVVGRELTSAAKNVSSRVRESDHSNSGSVSMWGPFAGYGTRGRHVAWLLDDQGQNAGRLREIVGQRFERRSISDATVDRATLTRKGLTPDHRDYYLLKRHRASLGLYITQFGEDLYVSQVSYSLGPISRLRIYLFLGLLIFQGLYVVIGGPIGVASAALSGSNSDVGIIVFLMLCCVGPLFLASNLVTVVIAMFAIYRWITDKDILAPFRVRPNEFDEDDLIALEKAVEQTVREGLDAIDIDSKLMPPAPEYGLRRRLV